MTANVAAESGSGSSVELETYRVNRGDSLWSIARRHNTTVDTLKDLNSLSGTRIVAGQTITVRGSTITNQGTLTATAGTLPLSDQNGKPLASIFYTAYTRTGFEPAERPVTFVFNGGPGAASVYLHLGLVGPRVADIAIPMTMVKAATTTELRNHVGKFVSNSTRW